MGWLGRRRAQATDGQGAEEAKQDAEATSVRLKGTYDWWNTEPYKSLLQKESTSSKGKSLHGTGVAWDYAAYQKDLAKWQREIAASILSATPYIPNTSSGASGGNITITQGTGTTTTPIWQGTTQYQYATSTQPSWEVLLKKVVEEAVKEATHELNETVKDLQEQIDDLWEAMNDGDE